MSEPNIGDWVQPSWSGHAYAGQTGQIIDEGQNPNGVEYWKIDIDGDGVRDYTVNKGDNKFFAGSTIHPGAMKDSMLGIGEYGEEIFDAVAPVCLAVVALFIFIKFIKKFKSVR